MYALILSDDDQVVRGYGPYEYEDEADEAYKKLDALFPVERDGLYLEKVKLLKLPGY